MLTTFSSAVAAEKQLAAASTAATRQVMERKLVRVMNPPKKVEKSVVAKPLNCRRCPVRFAVRVSTFARSLQRLHDALQLRPHFLREPFDLRIFRHLAHH